MKTYKLLFAATFLAVGLIAQSAIAQTLVISDESTALIEGTSNIHDWDADVPDVSGEIKADKKFMKRDLPKIGDELESVSLAFKVATIDGGKGAVMNNKIYAAFKQEQHPEITFQSTAPIIVKAVDKEKKTFDMEAKGELTMAGVTKPVTIDVIGTRSDDGKMKFSASQPVDMTEYEIEPPSAMFGQIRTGKEVTVKFDIVANE